MTTPRLPVHAWTTDLAQKEDGKRVEETENSFEWWYFDAIMDDGSTCVIVFLTKMPFASGPLSPILLFNISPPHGQYLQKQITLPAESYSASTTHCQVRMGTSSAEGNLRTYVLHAEADDLGADLELHDFVPGWRTGPFLTPDQAAQQWLGEQIVIPSGTVKGTLTYNGKTHRVSGTCYHDHQWGGGVVTDARGAKATSWYWGRTRVGDHSIVFAQVLGTVGGGPIMPVATIFMLARGTRISYDDDVTALSVTPLSGDAGQGVVVEWKSNLGGIHLTLPSPKEIANLNKGGYRRYLSLAVLRSDFDGEAFSGQGHGIWEINVLA